VQSTVISVGPYRFEYSAPGCRSIQYFKVRAGITSPANRTRRNAGSAASSSSFRLAMLASTDGTQKIVVIAWCAR
jgi:hypothetical protein